MCMLYCAGKSICHASYKRQINIYIYILKLYILKLNDFSAVAPATHPQNLFRKTDKSRKTMYSI